ncbi:hypothetical protein DOLIC_00083 [Dolichomitus sp. PSUC_FEM 10030005]|nr:hypothetical protein [Dolichomitus sp. PSUC_FEM 10030005]
MPTTNGNGEQHGVNKGQTRRRRKNIVFVSPPLPPVAAATVHRETSIFSDAETPPKVLQQKNLNSRQGGAIATTGASAFGDIIFSSVHGLKRQRVLESHAKYLQYIKNGGTIDDFKSLIVYFIQSGKSRSYCKSVIITLVRLLKNHDSKYERPFPESMIYSAYRSATKISENLQSSEKIFDAYGNEYKPATIVNSAETVTQTNNSTISRVNHGVTTHMEMPDAERIKKFAVKELRTFLTNRSPTTQYNADIELYLLIILLSNTGMRNGELLGLTLNQVYNWIEHNDISVKCKSGMAHVCIGTLTAQMLRDFISHPARSKFSSSNSRLFVFTYAKLRRRNIALFKRILKREKPSGLLFHVWRSLFTEKAHALSPLVTQHALNHKNANTTGRYVRNQLLHDVSLKKQLLNNIESF